jgi:hypothetical protein
MTLVLAPMFLVPSVRGVVFEDISLFLEADRRRADVADTDDTRLKVWGG